MFKWYKTAKKILKNEPEVWINYLQGQQLDNITYLAEKKSRYPGLLLQLIKYPYFIFSNLDIPFKTSDSDTKKCDYYVFAGTNNQLSSLDSTVQALKDNQQKVVLITFESLISDRQWKEYQPLKFSLTDAFRGITLMLTRSPQLYNDLKNLHPNALKHWYSEFCTIYSYLTYFERVLTTNQAKCVITSNDHNIPNRCLLAVAHELGIKTAYLQHASVSSLFPALRVNYAFLDGESALDTYKKCEANQIAADRNLPRPKVFLTGHKKPIDKSDRVSSSFIPNIGIAFNVLDNLDDVISLAEQLLFLNQLIIIRWHPRQSVKDVDYLKNHFRKVHNIFFSDPSLESVDQYLLRIKWMISGNSSIHLEAALAGVIPIYYELSPTTHSDYYGYVKSNLAIRANDFDEIESIIRREFVNNKSRDLAVRYYSSTYNTHWEGNEGKLVAECLIALDEGRPTPIELVSL